MPSVHNILHHHAFQFLHHTQSKAAGQHEAPFFALHTRDLEFSGLAFRVVFAPPKLQRPG
jgi:hypothetical protein